MPLQIVLHSPPPRSGVESLERESEDTDVQMALCKNASDGSHSGKNAAWGFTNVIYSTFRWKVSSATNWFTKEDKLREFVKLSLIWEELLLRLAFFLAEMPIPSFLPVFSTPASDSRYLKEEWIPPPQVEELSYHKENEKKHILDKDTV